MRNRSPVLLSLVFWGVILAFGIGTFLALVRFDAVDPVMTKRVAGAIIMVGALGMLYGTPRERRDRRSWVSAAAFTALGAVQFIPSGGITAAITMLAALCIWAAVLRRPRSVFAR